MKICRSEPVSFAIETFTKVRKGTKNDLLNVIRKPVLAYCWIPYLRKTASIWN